MTRRQDISEYKFADLAIDVADFRVRKNGETRKITPRAFEVLLYLIEHRGRVVEKQEIFDRVWRENFVSDNALTRVVREIRQVIGDDAAAPRCIETVPKRGYRFIAEVEETERQIAAETAAGEEPPVFSDRRAASKFPIFAAVSLLLAAVLTLGGWFALREKSATAAAPAVARTAQITRWSGLDHFPAISPDGNALAYSSDRSGNFEIYVKPLAPDARETQLTADGNQNFQPAFSPDGQLVAFHSKKRGGIWIVPAAGGTARQLTTFGTSPAWSPDGRTFAFHSGARTDLGAVGR
jgi:DNA-binding winged helix-turn-helix (wHTH) protein